MTYKLSPFRNTPKLDLAAAHERRQADAQLVVVPMSAKAPLSDVRTGPAEATTWSNPRIEGGGESIMLRFGIGGTGGSGGRGRIGEFPTTPIFFPEKTLAPGSIIILLFPQTLRAIEGPMVAAMTDPAKKTLVAPQPG